MCWHRNVLSTLPLLALVACVEYRPSPVEIVQLGEEAALPPPGPLSFEAAVTWALEHNPDLLALRARAAAVNLDPPPEPVEVSAGVDSSHAGEAEVTFEALSLLGLTVRDAERALARARRSEALLRHHERAREIAAEIAEAYEVERVLGSILLPEVALDAETYVKAGLETEVAETAVAATAAERDAEAAARQSERRTNRHALARLLGARPDASVELGLPPAPWPVLPEPEWQRLLATRADLQRGLATYEVAESELRRAVAAQYPALVLTPGVGVDPLSFFGHVGLRIPLGAGREIRAAESARDAARLELAGAALDALKEAADAREEAEAARRRLEAARRRLTADEDLFRVSKARLEAVSGPFIETALAAQGVVESARELREAAVEEVRARVRAARAAGWPAPEISR